MIRKIVIHRNEIVLSFTVSFIHSLIYYTSISSYYSFVVCLFIKETWTCFKLTPYTIGLVEETNDLSTDVLATSLLVVHNTLRSGQDDVSELTAGEQVAGPHLNLVQLHIEAGRDATALVQTTSQSDHDLSGTVVINHGDFTNVT